MSESSVKDRFLRYISMDTQSAEEKEPIPSTEKQKVLAGLLAEELRGMGASAVTLDSQSYVYAVIPATTQKELPVVGFIAHMDTSPDASGKDVKARMVSHYDGKEICLNEKEGILLSPDYVHGGVSSGTSGDSSREGLHWLYPGRGGRPGDRRL